MDSIVRLKVDSREYDDRIARAQKGIQALDQQVRTAGGSFSQATKAQVEYVRSIGSMNTQSASAKGKVRELSDAFTQLSVQYKNLTAAEKQSPFGQAMQASMTQLKARTQELQGQLNAATQSLNQTGDGSNMEQLLTTIGSKMGIPVEMFTKLGAAGAVAGAAVKVVSDALSSNELVVDAWGQTVSSAKSIYSGFLNALNTGNFSRFFSNMGAISRAAKEAYDSMDALGTFNAFNQVNLERARTGYNEAVAAYREGTGSKRQVQTASDALIEMMEQQQKREQEVYDKAIKDYAAKYGLTTPEQVARFSEVIKGSYEQYEAVKATPVAYHEEQQEYIDLQTGRSIGTYTRKVRDEIQPIDALVGEALRHLNDTGDVSLDSLQKLGLAAEQTANAMEQQRKAAARILGQADKAGETAPATAVETPAAPLTLSKQLEQQRAELLTRMREVGYDTPAEYKQFMDELADIERQINDLKGLTAEPIVVETKVTGDLSPTETGIVDMTQTLNQRTQANVKDVSQLAKEWQMVSSAISSVGSAMGSIDNPAAKVAGIIANAIASIAMGFASAVAADAKFGSLPMAMAAVTAGATMMSAIAAIRSATQGYAEGGIIGGNHPSGDNILARVNSGEGILTAQGMANLGAIFDQTAASNRLQLTATIRGEDILLAAGNAQRRRGARGEYLRTR